MAHMTKRGQKTKKGPHYGNKGASDAAKSANTAGVKGRQRSQIGQYQAAKKRQNRKQ